MWWIALIVVAVIMLALVAVAIVKGINHDKGDYKDGGGIQLGGDERIPFFTPANEKAGMRGERHVNYHLRPLLREDEYLLANVLLPLKNGHKTEIDCILISRKGVFCVETKNWVGHVKGSDEDEEWVQVYDDPDRANRHHRNPVIQNKEHCEVLERKLDGKYKVANIVIFAKIGFILGVDSEYAFTINEFKNYYRGLNDKLFLPDLVFIRDKLSKYIATEEELKQHRIDTHNRFN